MLNYYQNIINFKKPTTCSEVEVFEHTLSMLPQKEKSEPEKIVDHSFLLFFRFDLVIYGFEIFFTIK